MADLAILTSGGDAPGMNTAIAAATKVALGHGARVHGVLDGYEGLMDGRLQPLTAAAVAPTWHRGGTALGSARSQRFMTAEGRAAAAEQLRSRGIPALVVIGGNGSLTGASRLAAEHGIRVVGIPASIDHDLACTTHALGVDTALNTIIEACDRISDTASSHRRCFVVEVMGRQCGYLAMAAAIGAQADAVLFREQGKSEETLAAELAAMLVAAVRDRQKKRVLIIKAEGVEVPTERIVARLEAVSQEHGLGMGVRWTVLGHVVRGGSPTFRDRLVAGRLAHGAVWAALAGPPEVQALAASEGVMVGWEPREADALPTPDRSVALFGLSRVLAETQTLLSGEHPTTRARVQLLRAVQGVLAL